MCACIGMKGSICTLESILREGRKGSGLMRRQNKVMEVSGDTQTHTLTHTPTQMCYSRCKNQCSLGKAFALLVQGVRMPSVAFNYSLSPRPVESDWFSFSPPPTPPQRSRQMESLDLSIQRNTGQTHRHYSQSHFNGVLVKQSPNSHWGKFHGERHNHVWGAHWETKAAVPTTS